MLAIGVLLISGPRLGAPDHHHGVMLGAAAGTLFGVSDVAIKALTGARRRSARCSSRPGSWSRCSPRSSPSTPPRAGMQEGEAVPVIAATSPPRTSRASSAASSSSAIRCRRTRSASSLQGLAFALVVVAAARHAAAGARGGRERPPRTGFRTLSRRRRASSNPALVAPCGTAVRRPSKWIDKERHGHDRGSRGGEPHLQELARRHLWMHFTRMGAFDEAHEIPIIVRGDGCYVFDEHGNRYLDGLSALFCVNIGHGRAEVAQAGADQAQSSASSRTGPTRTRRRSSWRRAIAELAPGDLNRVFFTTGGSRGGRVGAEALPPVPQAHRQPRALQGDRAQDRLPRHDDGRADRDRHPGAARAVRAAVPRLGARAEHEPATAPEVDDPRRGDPRADRVRGARDRRRA